MFEHQAKIMTRLKKIFLLFPIVFGAQALPAQDDDFVFHSDWARDWYQGGERLYRPGEVLELLADAASHPVVAWTRACVEDAQSLGFSHKDLYALLRLAVSSG